MTHLLVVAVLKYQVG